MSEYGPQTGFSFGWNVAPNPSAVDITEQFAQQYELDDDSEERIVTSILAGIRAITESVKEHQMIKFAGENQAGSSQRGNRSGIPFLKVENVAPNPKPCRILAVKQGQDNKGKEQVTLKINYSGPVYLWSLRLNNPNVQHLIDMFGSDEAAWKDQEFMLGLEADEFSGRNWPRALPIQKKRGA